MSTSAAESSSYSVSSAVGNGATASRALLPFDVLVQQWKAEISASASALAKPWCKARDLEQAGLIALWRAMGHFKPTLGNFSHYARRAIKRAMVRECIKSSPISDIRPDFVSLDDEDFDGPGFEADPFSNTNLVGEWVRGLPERLAQVYELLYRQGFSQTEAAQIMGVSQSRIAQLHAQLLSRGKIDLVELVA